MDRTADLNWPKTHSILWNVLLSIYMEESWLRATDRCTGMGCTLVSGWWVTALCITCFPLSLFKLFFTIIITIIIFYIISIITVFSTCEFYLFPVPLLIPLWGKEGACGFVVLTEWLGLKHSSIADMEAGKHRIKNWGDSSARWGWIRLIHLLGELSGSDRNMGLVFSLGGVKICDARVWNW